MSDRKTYHDVVLGVSMTADPRLLPKDVLARCRALLAQIECGAYDWCNLARMAWSSEAKGGLLTVSGSWQDGHGIIAQFDCSLPSAPTIYQFRLCSEGDEGTEPPLPMTQCFGVMTLALRGRVDYTYRDVLKALTYRITDCQFEIDNPIIGFDREHGPYESAMDSARNGNGIAGGLGGESH